MKRNIAIIAGGDQSEVAVSLKSAAGLLSFIDKEKYNPFLITIIKGEWTAELDCQKYPVDQRDLSFTTHQGSRIKADYALITIHGTPGEDGKLQGMLDLLGIPYNTCGVLASALTYNKYVCNTFLSAHGITTAKRIRIRRGDSYDAAAIVEEVGLPLFCKPADGGSSFGVTRVTEREGLPMSIEKALNEGTECVIEAELKGREISQGIYKLSRAKHTILPITEVRPQGDYFDYAAKYQGKVEEITPAPLDPAVTEAISQTTQKVYDLIGAHGIIRVDYIIAADGTPQLLEVNTTPGMTPTSFIPQQVKAMGKTMAEVLSEIIEDQTASTPNDWGTPEKKIRAGA